MPHSEDTLTPDLFDNAPAAAQLPAQPPPPPPASGGDNGPPEDPKDYLSLADYAERCYLAYAMSVVKGRALPNVEDGMKPVQRRILFSMREMGLGSATKHVKSARVVGDVIGKLHPHGDQSVYDAMVRMAQSFTLRYPLIDGQGNFGSRDGDGAAAMRYTESRLTPIAELLLAEIDAGTVDFKPNYDGAFQEPALLPARLPMLLANGASGIAVGMATEMPPHNLREIAEAAIQMLKHPETSTQELMTHIPGPDFPGGGQIISSPADILSAYETGRGSLRVRARWEVEPLARGQWRIVVTQLPPGVSTAQVLTQIEAITNPQVKTGKKELSQEQKTLKTAMLSALETVRDESDEKAPVRIVLEPHSRNQDAEAFMRMLLAQTSLETTAPMNLTVVGRDGRPGQKSLRALLLEWVDFRLVSVHRRSQFRLDAVNRRIHILEGRQAVLLNIDEVIRVIREADDPKADLIAAFGLSEIQAEDILEIRLRQLARLEGIKIEKELGELREERDGLLRIIGDGVQNNAELKRIVVAEIRADAKKYGDDRRTLIETAVAMTASVAEANIADEPVTVIVSKNGWMRARTGHGVDLSALQYKAGDAALAVIETRTVWPLVLLDSVGRTYSIRISDLPTGRGDGVPMSSLLDLARGARLMFALSAAPETKLLVASDSGYGFICQLSDLLSRQRAGKAFLTLEENGIPLQPLPLLPLLPSLTWVAAAADNGKLLAFPLEEMKTLSGGKGVQIIKLEDKEHLTALTLFNGERLLVEGKTRTSKPASLTLTGAALIRYLLHRARKGHDMDKISIVTRLAAE